MQSAGKTCIANAHARFRHDTHLNVWDWSNNFATTKDYFCSMRFGHWGMFFSVATLSSNYEKRYFTRIEIIKFSFCSYEAILSRSKRNGEFYGDFVSHFFRFCSSKLSLKFHIFCASITLFIHMSVLQIYSILDLVALIGDIHHINEEFVFEICLLFFASIGTQLLILCK